MTKKMKTDPTPTVTVPLVQSPPLESNGDGDIATFTKLTKTEVDLAADLDRREALALVGLYTNIQKVRVGASNRVSAHERQVDVLADFEAVQHLKEGLKGMEGQIQRLLRKFAKAQPLGQWALSIIGVGDVIAAGLLAHIDLRKAPTAGAIWNFAGLNPDQVWLPKTKRPYNAALKTLTWKLGEQFKRQSTLHPDALYCRLYRERKAQEVERNEAGKFADHATRQLQDRIKKGRRISPEQREVWSSGKLQPLGLDLRAMRYAVKIFLSHYHTVGLELMGLPVVKPWVIEHGGHVHYIEPPNQELIEQLKKQTRKERRKVARTEDSQ